MEEESPCPSTPVPRPAVTGRPRWLVAAGLVALGGLALGIRCLTFRSVFRSDVVLFSGDPYYHIWRTLYSVRNFPAVLEKDPFVNFPKGGEVPWPPGFDWSVAALIRLLGLELPEQAEMLAAWVPPVLGTATVLLASWIAARRVSPLAGAVAGVVLALIHASARWGSLGFFDHHVAVAFGTTGLLGLGMAVLRPHDETRRRAWPVAWGLLWTALLLVWNGALLHVLVLQGSAVFWMLAAPRREVAAIRARRLGVAHALVALLLAPFALGRSWTIYGSFTPLVLSSFQPAWFGGGAAALFAVALLWGPGGQGQRLRERITTAAAIGAAGAGLALLLVPGLQETLADSAGWFTGRERFHTKIAELQPLLHRGHFDVALRYFSPLVFVFPLAWLALALRYARRPERFDLALLLVWSAIFAAAALGQRRFANSAAVPFALVLGAAADQIVRALEHTSLWRRRPRIATAGCLAALALALAPLVHTRALEAAKALEEPPPSRGDSRLLAFRDASRWLRKHSPEVSFEKPEYGVLTAWGLGHLVRYESRRPMVQDNFNVYAAPANVLRAMQYFESRDEEKALRLLREMRVRYVVADPRGAGRPEPYGRRTMARRLVPSAGRARGKRTGGRKVRTLPALEHHRLVYDSRRTGHGPPVRVFERVAGARVEGRARPDALVALRLELREAGMGLFVYRRVVRAAASGRFIFRMPYPTTGEGSDLVPEGPASLSSGGYRETLRISAEAVRTGARVRAPELGPPRLRSP